MREAGAAMLPLPNITVDDLRASDRIELQRMAIESGSTPQALMIEMIGAYLHLYRTVDFVLPKNGPGVSLAKAGRG